MAYFAVLAVTDNHDEHNVKTEVLFHTVGSYKSAIDFHTQMYEKLEAMTYDPFDKKSKKIILDGSAEIHALLVEPDLFQTFRELHEKKLCDAGELLQRKVIAKFDVTEYVKYVIEEKWPNAAAEEKPTAAKGKKK
jgi:hypothetical protein